MTFTGSLLPYQPEAVDRILERHKMLIAYDLGLGKTIIAIAALEQMMDAGIITEPGLVIALSSLKYQWAAQITKFTAGTSTPLVIDGTPKQRAEQYARAMDWQNSGVDYVICNYEQVVNDWKQVSALPRGFVVMDEATAIKGFRAKRSKLVKKLDSPIKLALTGTPIENGKPEELYSIMQAVDADLLGRFDLFDSTFIVRGPFGNVSRYRNLPLLHKTLMGAAVRKTQDDEDVRPFLPDKIVPEPILVPFDPPGRALYRRIATDLLDDLDEAVASFGGTFSLFAHYGMGSDLGGPADQLRGRLMSKITVMRMLCDHPDLVRKSAQDFSLMHGTGSQYAHELLEDGALDKIKVSNKLTAVVDYVNQFLDEDPEHKAVIFTSFVLMADLLKSAFSAESVTYTGQMNAKTKETAKQHFQTDPHCRLFISSDAGGYGVDLPQASLLVNYDLPWSSGLAVQRNGRIRRAMSKWPAIVVQDVLMRGSIEERQRATLDDKIAVAAAVIEGQGFNDKGGVDLTATSLSAYLRTVDV